MSYIIKHMAASCCCNHLPKVISSTHIRALILQKAWDKAGLLLPPEAIEPFKNTTFTCKDTLAYVVRLGHIL